METLKINSYVPGIKISVDFNFSYVKVWKIDFKLHYRFPTFCTCFSQKLYSSTREHNSDVFSLGTTCQVGV